MSTKLSTPLKIGIKSDIFSLKEGRGLLVGKKRSTGHKNIELSLGYKFKRPFLLEQALTHRSYANEHPESESCHNERLEFLGDAVLNLALSALLLQKFPDLPEGSLSRIRAGQVNEKKLAQMAMLLELGTYLNIGRGEEMTGGREKPSLLADAFEALLGAVFLDGGFKSSQTLIARLFQPHLKDDLEITTCDYKTLLQEYCQGKLKKVPEYQLLQEEGPDHQKTFLIEVKVTDGVVCTGKGRTKKEAQQRAAKSALLQLQPAPQARGNPGKSINPRGCS